MSKLYKPQERFFLCIDGLDEYDAAPAEQTELVENLKILAQYNNVKICVASRPWPVFQHAFEAYPQFRLEKLTRKDIGSFVKGSFAAIPEYRLLQQEHDVRCAQLEEGIVNKASGVFLWVFLVLRSLKEGVIDGENVNKLFHRLDEIPEDLDLFFERIIKSIPDHQRREANLYFRTMLSTTEDQDLPSVMALSFVEEDDGDFGVSETLQRVSEDLLTAR